jgi:hypothetical protein
MCANQYSVASRKCDVKQQRKFEAESAQEFSAKVIYVVEN